LKFPFVIYGQGATCFEEIPSEKEKENWEIIKKLHLSLCLTAVTKSPKE